MDESGISSGDPVLVVAAVIIEADKELIAIEKYLESLVEKHIPAQNRDGFVFHATDIYGGGKADCLFHDRTVWPNEKRSAILEDLLAVPAKFDLSICVGLVQASEFPAKGSQEVHTPAQIALASHAVALAQCEMAVEFWMRKNAPNEVAVVIAENNNDVRKAAKDTHIYLRSAEDMKKAGMDTTGLFPFTSIRDGIHFATKSESRHLQIADACAWAFHRAAVRGQNAERFYPLIRKQIVSFGPGDEAFKKMKEVQEAQARKAPTNEPP
ncbi:MAG TPA: DUF3800 domain-containing protein [Bradyrhizobium sp.]|nr:DUF3800 domain-containing protein [Bradyrhizobium sp.]